MTVAEIEGKLTLHESSREDLLTADVFGPLRYLRDFALLHDILSRSINLDGINLEVPELDAPQVHFWPKLEHRNIKAEPDVLVVHDDFVVLIEVKYLSGKSSGMGDDPATLRDQLAREYQVLEKWADHRSALVYLTTHPSIPKEDILSALEDLRRNAAHMGKAFTDSVRASIFWLSWRAVTDVVETAIEATNRYNRGELAVLNDMFVLLQRKGLIFFRGITIPAVTNSGKITFYSVRPPLPYWDSQFNRKKQEYDFAFYHSLPQPYNWSIHHPHNTGGFYHE